ncbi:lactoylglutathione lyase [Natranaerovirga pectinivora]|uniref:Lactoylglutathione lyase n=1 Tax=Natranaerovirga pectinivora TaxID=682400 RepID=A0A4R3MP11_9FIRM|nr:VOC family protein [Natranaerovirga pectinivora]TCT14554.1 lactoylglutathione lyase [Natranaerovirga pectinivora]
MKFSFSTLFVKDIEESVQFYQEIVGIPIKSRLSPAPNLNIVFMGDDEAQIELIQDSNKKIINIGSDISWGFTVNSVEEVYEFVKKQNVTILSDIIQPKPSVKYFFIEDPNGMKIQFVETNT